MTCALDRLRTLRRQAGAPAPAHRSDDDARPGARTDDRTVIADSASLTGTPAKTQARSAHTIDDLRRLLRVRAPVPAQAPAVFAAIERTLPGDEIAPGLRLIEHRLPWQAMPQSIALGFDPRIAHAATEDMVLFDTETTGLAGGTGTRAFMIGIAQWRCDALHVRQWFITRLQAEPALLSAFAAAVDGRSVLVSYNGRSYDAPLLRTRCRLARIDDPTAGCAHVDLLHPTRRRYRGRWENCRLATIERRVLDVVREDDLPGSEAPAAWLRYLRGGCGRDLGRVAEHNRQDLVSLAGLLMHLAATAQTLEMPDEVS